MLPGSSSVVGLLGVLGAVAVTVGLFAVLAELGLLETLITFSSLVSV